MYSDEVDFRKGIAGLCNLIMINFPNENIHDALFLFFSKNRRQVKIIEMSEDDVWLYQNKLQGYKFVYPKSDKSAVVNAEQLEFILSSLERIKSK